MAANAKHAPVLLNEVLEALDPKLNQHFVDCTLGGGGHTIEILRRTSPHGKVLGIDLDVGAIEIAKQKISSSNIQVSRLVAAQGNFNDLEKIVLQNNFKNISGVLLDLGFSSMEIADPGRGLSFQIDAPLDMRYGKDGITAAEIINTWKEKDLEKIFREYGEEGFSRRIAKKICEARVYNPVKRTLELVGIIAQVIPKKFQHGRTHFATKVFQALRIAVNDELNNLKKVLPQAVRLLSPGGRLAVISFHSLEDRIVKQFFKKESSGCICPKEAMVCQCGHEATIKIINKKPIIPKEGEAKTNPRSRSAKLRAAERL